MSENPKVFISHASEDKDRFVLGFAKRLRENGVDAWVDQWEMLPGDSIVDRIFNEGLKDAQAVVVVVSQTSVAKPWVREELNASVVKQIENQCRLIPVVIDDCDIPEALKTKVWERIKDASNYDSEFTRILNAIFGHYEKPPLGVPPAYVRAELVPLPGLTKSDTLLFKIICDTAIAGGSKQLQLQTIEAECRSSGIHGDELDDALRILGNRGYLELKTINQRVILFSITTYGFETYAQEHLPDHGMLVHQVALAIANQGLRDNTAIAQAIGRPLILVNFVLDVLEQQGLLKKAGYLGGSTRITSLTPELKRWLRQ